MEREPMLAAVAAEGAQITAQLSRAGEDDFDRPTRCRPWSVRELLAHLLVAVNRLPSMLAEPEPPDAEVSAAGYYRADRRFAPDATEARVEAAVADAASFGSGEALAQAFDEAWKGMVAVALAEPAGRLVLTRWGDAMALEDFLVTRVVELGVHGLDLAEGLGRRPWLTSPAAVVIERLLLRDTTLEAMPELGWDRLTLIEAATGRRSLTDSQRAVLSTHGVRALTFG